MIYYISLSSVTISLAAHLFIVGQFVMVINLCIRRRGMGSNNDLSLGSYEYSSEKTISNSSSGKSTNSKKTEINKNLALDMQDINEFKDIYQPVYI